MSTRVCWIIMPLTTFFLGGCIVIPVPTGGAEPYAEVATFLPVEDTSKDDVLRRFGKPAASYSHGSRYVYTKYKRNWEIWEFIAQSGGGASVKTAGKQHFLVLDFDEEDRLTNIRADIADDWPGSCSETGICHDGAAHLVQLASAAEETDAKKFSISNEQCGIYFYSHKDRNTRKTTVTLDGEYQGYVGQWGIRPFFFWRLDPGKHEITYYPGPGTLSFSCREGELMFVRLRMNGEVPSSLELVNHSKGRKQIRSSGAWYPKRKLIVPESGHPKD